MTRRFSAVAVALSTLLLTAFGVQGAVAAVKPPAPFARGTLPRRGTRRNATTGAYGGVWQVVPDVVDLSGTNLSVYGIDSSHAVNAAIVGVSHRFQEEGVSVGGVGGRAARLFNSTEPRGAELSLSSSSDNPLLVKGQLLMWAGNVLRKYNVRGAFILPTRHAVAAGGNASDGGGAGQLPRRGSGLHGARLRIMAVGKGLQPLVATPYLPADRLVPSAMAASYSVVKLLTNATMWFGRGWGATTAGPSTSMDTSVAEDRHEQLRGCIPRNAVLASAPSGGVELVRIEAMANATLRTLWRGRDPADDPAHDVHSKTWDTVLEDLQGDRCVWFGDLDVRATRADEDPWGSAGSLYAMAAAVSETMLTSDNVASSRTSRRDTGYALSGRLTSLTCRKTLDVHVSHAALAQAIDEELWFLVVGFVVTVGHAVAIQRQMRYGMGLSNNADVARTAWVSFLLLGVLEWSLLEVHWNMLHRMPQLMHAILGLSFFHLLILHLCARQAYNVLDANRGSMWALPVYSLPLNILGWFAIERTPVVWVPCLFLAHSVWLPQIYYSAKHTASPPIAPTLLATTVLSRLYYVGHELLYPSFRVAYAPRPGLFALLTAWLLAQSAFILLQRRLDPSFFLPSSWQSAPLYDYHRPIPDDLAAHPAGTVSSAGAPNTRKRTPTGDVEAGGAPRQAATHGHDCVICQAAIDVAAPADYMLPPCGHLFHTECLTEWMTYKMECPVCRGTLPYTRG